MIKSKTAALAGVVPMLILAVLVLLAWPGGAQAHVIEIASVANDGTQGEFGSDISSISADGRYVAFGSQAPNLVPGDTNSMPDIFVRDRLTGITERVSVATSGAEANGSSADPAISADGRYVVFCSEATNLVVGDTNLVVDVFVHDRQTGTTRRASVASDGTESNAASSQPCASADGRYVVFCSDASSLVVGDTNGKKDVFLRDCTGGTTERESVDSGEMQGNNDTDFPSLSADGRYVAFESTASNLVPADGNGTMSDIFVRDRTEGTTELVSLTSDEEQVMGGSQEPSINADGRYVAFASLAEYLVPGDTNYAQDIFVRDRVGGTTERVSVASGGAQANGWSFYPMIDGDGRYVAFWSWASNLVPGDANGQVDVFVHDRQTNVTVRANVAADGTEANNQSSDVAISADGRYVTFASDATNLVAGDTNARRDVFVATNFPTVTGIDPSLGPASGATEVTITGYDFAGMTPAGAVTFGETPATYVIQSAYEITATAPAHASGVVQVQVTGTGGASADTAADDYTYVDPPSVTGLVPDGGPPAGGTSVTITGTGFTGIGGPVSDPDAVTFGGVNATTYTVDSATQITATAPAHAAATVDVRVTTDYGSSADTPGDDYTYVDPPSVTGLVPNMGPTAGGTSVTITGTDFTGIGGPVTDPDAVTFGGVNATTYTVDSATQITATAPAHGAGTVQVQVTAAGGPSADTPADDYTYADPPAVTGLTPAVGPTAGGTSVTITGTDFTDIGGPATDPDAVTFGGVNATTYTVDSATQITATAPAHAKGGVQVQVSTPYGSSPDTPADDFTYQVTYTSIRGTDRYDTAIKISKALFPTALPAGSGVVLAPGETFQEALCGGPLAAAWGGPVLLTYQAALANNVKAELQRLAPARVFLIGMSTAVVAAVSAALPTATVTALNGSGGAANIVYDMSRKVANALAAKAGTGGKMPSATAIICVGTNFPDAIGVGPLACANLWPILLTNSGGGGAVHTSAAGALSDLGITKAIKVGTYAALPAGVTGLANLSGSDRYATNKNVAQWGKDHGGLLFTHVGMATGDKFPDALASGPYLKGDHGILLLSPLTGPLPPVIAALLTANQASVQHVTFIACIEPVIGQVKACLP